MATQVEALPDDALADVFRRLPPRSLAVVRCVRKAWRDVVDSRALLLPHLHLLPRTVRGVFINYLDHPHHFARPCSPSTTTTTTTTIPRVDGTLSFLPNPNADDGLWRVSAVLDHCNGLLLLCGKRGLGELCMCNPATRRWTVLPRWWEEAEDADDDDERRHRYAGAYVAFDPAESPQYEVILVPAVPEAPDRWSAAEVHRRALLWEEENDAPFCLDWFFSLPEADGTATIGQWEFQELSPSDLQLPHDINDPCRYMEWPPAPWTLRVFSSSTGQWENRDFVREGISAGTVEKIRWDFKLPSRSRPLWRYAVYRHGSLYVHCRGSFVARLSLSKSKYQIIETPVNVDEYTKPYLGKLHNSVCFGIVHDHQLKIWILNESCGRMEWVLKYETVVRHLAKYLASISPSYIGRRHDGSWTLEENIESEDTDYDVESRSEENIEIQDSDHEVESHIEIQDIDHVVESLSEEGHEWDSDNDDTFSINTESQEYIGDDHNLNIIGLHPYKEVVFLVGQFQVIAYHLNNTKVQYLGNSRPEYCYHDFFWNRIYESFLYTPCMMGDLLHGDQADGHSSSED